MPPSVYDVALSFAGEERKYVRQVATYLRAHGIRIFYDEFEQVRLVGRDLVADLDRIYRKESLCVVMFISEAYKAKKWTRHEFRSAMAAAIERLAEFVIPVRFDQAELDGLQPTIGYVDASVVKPAELGKLVLQKLSQLSSVEEELTHDLEVWRVVGARNAPYAFYGEGIARVGGRWSKQGTRVVYAASTLCAAVLELGPLASSYSSAHFVGLGARVSTATPVKHIAPRNLPVGWRDTPAPEQLQRFGTEWARTGDDCAIAIPSRVLPRERLYLLNPAHADFRKLTIFSEEPVDLRLFRQDR